MEIGNKAGFDLPTLEEKLNYSVVLIRRGRADEAIVLLTPLTRQYTDNIILHSHFATAHFLSPNPADHAKAPGLMKDCLTMWPEEWKDLDEQRQAFLRKQGWGEGLFEQNRKYEVYLHKLMQLRRKAPAGLALDPLFGSKEKPVSFVDEKGKYQAGQIPVSEREKLPGDAIEIVEQLSVWMPADPRLYWLLAELFNATAMSRSNPEQRYDYIKAASMIMNEISNNMRKKDVPQDLTDHLAVIDSYLRTNDRPTPNLAAVTEIVKQGDKKDQDNSKLDSDLWWRTVIVAFLSGLALGLFTIWQYQEMRRRRQAQA